MTDFVAATSAFQGRDDVNAAFLFHKPLNSTDTGWERGE